MLLARLNFLLTLSKPNKAHMQFTSLRPLLYHMGIKCKLEAVHKNYLVLHVHSQLYYLSSSFVISVCVCDIYSLITFFQGN